MNPQVTTRELVVASGVNAALVPQHVSKLGDPAELGVLGRDRTCANDSFLMGMDRIETLDEALAAVGSLRTGDLLLYQNADIGSVFNQAALQATFSHAGVVVEMAPEEAKELYPEDYAHHPPPADPRVARLNVFEAVEGRGVCFFPLEARLARCIKYNRHVAFRRHRGPYASEPGGLAPDALREAMSFIREVRGRKLAVVTSSPYLFWDVLRLYCRCVPLYHHQDYAAFSCGELVVETLQHMRVLDRRIGSTSVLPTFLTTNDGVQGQVRLEKYLLRGHDYEAERLLVFPGAPYTALLVQRKKALAAMRTIQASQASRLPVEQVKQRRLPTQSAGLVEAIELY